MSDSIGLSRSGACHSLRRGFLNRGWSVKLILLDLFSASAQKIEGVAYA